jgi:hypothetical protein
LEPYTTHGLEDDAGLIGQQLTEFVDEDIE